jgi:hypothetical protein
MTTTFPPSVFRLIPKRGHNDCAIAALASYLRVDYEEVLLAAARIAPNVWRHGLTGPQMLAVCRRLGFKAQWRQRYDIDEASGILDLQFRDRRPDDRHVVLLLNGLVFECEHDPISVWEPDLYCAFFNAEPRWLLVVKDADRIPSGVTD